jgi:hypothetical protein
LAITRDRAGAIDRFQPSESWRSLGHKGPAFYEVSGVMKVALVLRVQHEFIALAEVQAAVLDEERASVPEGHMLVPVRRLMR